MARTYHAEGRQIANAVRGITILLGLALMIYTDLKKHWWVFFVILFIGALLGEIAGASWTKNRREEKRAKKRNSSSGTSGTTSTRKQPQPAQIRKRTDQQLLSANVDQLSGVEFERLMEMYYKDQGYEVLRTGGSGDYEVDLILTDKKGLKIAIQCKRWKKDVGSNTVLRLKSGKQVHGCYDAWIVTTSYFTKAAHKAAERLNIRLINGLELQNKLSAWKRKRGLA